MIEYGAILLLAFLSAAVALLLLFSNAFLGRKRPHPVKSQPFECGVEPIALPAGRLPVHFYIVAMLFVVFDVELVFLFPWAVLVRELGWFGLLEMGFFLAVVVAGFAYAWKQGALEFK
ncbi:MAG: NADH-quinone oxidoreductase subunit A [Candidatus Omnitrophica bacterium]|nr:NADH-quinone oxidoreductase subunit A [Candidatus Omnitrophota bacterium]MBI3020989.1 NADH-quinone oxidoreductase subunit A [Candidatus Omnitrophota bacterium]MBI3084047.1 NADH-quinone oxidoreductase subunit A [Candidatus Omnitrophota bacterium]